MARTSARSTQRVTIAHVAEAAGVSRATVSRVMNGLATVDPLIGARVREVARQLNYSPSTVARSLAIGRTNTVAIVVPDLANPMFQETLRGLNRAAARDGYRVLVADSIENPDEEVILAREARRRCDALVLVSPRMDAEALGELLPELAPVVLVNRESPVAGVPCLTVDYGAGIRSIVAELQRKGHERIVYLAGPTLSEGNRARSTALGQLRGNVPQIVYVQCGATFEDGYRVVASVIASRATAAICFNDLVALGLVSALHEAGIDVPGRISVTGFDDIPFARFSTPALTTASVPQIELGERAWDRLWALLNDLDPAHDLTITPRLVSRASVGPAPAELPHPETELAAFNQEDESEDDW